MSPVCRLVFLLCHVSSCFGFFRKWSPFDQLFLGPDGNPGDSFGSAIDVQNGTMLVGAFGDDDRNENAGAVYIYEKGSGNSWERTQKLVPTDGELQLYRNDEFGRALAIRGDFLAIGSPLREVDDGSTETDSGSIYIFERDEDGVWSQAHILNPSDAVESQRSGRSLSFFDDDTLIVGAPGNGISANTTGKLYIFERQGDGTWDEVQTVVPPDGVISGRFGFSVATDGLRVIVGAPNDDDNGFRSGSAYLLEVDGAGDFFPAVKLLPDDGQDEDWFGYSVDIDNGTVAIGAREDNDNFIGDFSGSVYMYHLDFESGLWDMRQKLTRTRPINRLFNRHENAFFGASVSLEGNFLAVSATSFSTRRKEKAGRVYVYRFGDGTNNRRRQRWRVEDIMGSCEERDLDNFGVAVRLDMSQNLLLIGSLNGGGRSQREKTAGAVHVYERRGFGVMRKLLCYLFY